MEFIQTVFELRLPEYIIIRQQWNFIKLRKKLWKKKSTLVNGNVTAKKLGGIYPFRFQDYHLRGYLHDTGRVLCPVRDKNLRAVYNWGLWFCIATLCDWSKHLAPLSPPIRSKARVSVLGVGYIFIELWLVIGQITKTVFVAVLNGV